MREKKENTPPSGSFRRFVFGKGIIIAVSLMLIYVLVGFFLTPYLVKRYAPQLVQDKLQRELSIGEVRTNPFLFTFEADNVFLADTDGRTLLGFDGLSVDFELSSLFRWAWTFRQIELAKPIVNIVVDPDGTLNLARMVPKSEKPQKETDTKPLRMILEKIAIRDGEIDITDQRQSTPATLKISPFTLELNDISTLPDRKGPYSLAAVTDDGTEVKWTGEVFLSPFRSTGSISFDNIKAATLYEFVSDAIHIDPPRGNLKVRTDYRMDFSSPEPQLTLSRLDLRLSDLSLTTEGAANSILDIGAIDINNAGFDLASRQLDIERASLGGGGVRLAVDENGALNLQRVFSAAPAKGAAADLSEPEEGRSAEEKKDPWKVNVGRVEIGDMALDYRDASVTPELVAAIGAIGVTFSAEAEVGGDQAHLKVPNIAVNLQKVLAGLADVTEPLIRVDTLVLEEGGFDLSQRAFSVSRIGLDGGQMDLERDRDGEVPFLHLVAPTKKRTIQRQVEDATAKGEPWQLAVKEIEVSGFSASLSDAVLKPGGQLLLIDPIAVKLSDVDGKSPMGFSLDLKIREGGSLTASGTIDPAGPSVESEINVAEVALTPFQPFVDSVANLVLHSGAFSSRGKLTYGQKSAGADLAFDGGFNLARLRITEPDAKETLLGWKALRTDNFKLRLQPNRLDIKELKLAQPVTQLIISEDGSVNLANVMKDRQSAAVPAGGGAAGDEKKKPFPVSISKVRVDNASLDFADLTLTPQFGAKIESLGGVIAGMSSSRDARAQVDLEGKVDQYGQAKIGGEIDTFDPVGFTDITMIFRNIEMSSLTPYSGKFAGRKIDSGKLSLDLEYKIDNGQLKGDHKIIVDRIQLGENVDSPDATNLPLDLAIALMEDTNGVIDIGLPVRGDLNDPKFSYGHLIGQALANLITKIVTAPFRVLGAMIPGGSEDLDSIGFEPGEHRLSPPEKEKIKRLAEALNKRPQLTLGVQGRYNAETDGTALKAVSVRRLLAAETGETIAPEDKPDPVDFGNPETQQALKALFRERFDRSALKKLEESLANQPEEGTASGAQPVPPDKVEDPGALSKAIFARLVESEPLGESTLKDLAAARGKAIVEELAASGGIPPDRVTVKEPAAVPEGKPASATLSLAVAGKS